MSGPILEEHKKCYELVNHAVNEYSLPGLQAGYKKYGEESIISTGGTFDYSRKEEVITEQHSFHIGSATKMFVAALFMRYVEYGRIRLDDTIDNWLPDYPNSSSITVESLLNHTSGIDETLFNVPKYLIGSMIHKQIIWNPNEVIIKIANTSSPKSLAQRSFLYSNNNYLILGVIAEKIENEKLSEILEREFFDPLEMHSTALLPGGKCDSINIVSGYDYFIPFGPHLIKPEQTSWDSLMFSAGAMVSNCSDLLLWIEALFNNKVVSSNSLKRMMEWTDSTDNGRDNSMVSYGLGISKYSIHKNILIGHPGAGFGGECFPFWLPETNTAIVVMYNESKKDNPAGKDILEKLIQLANRDISHE